ncbi:MAG: 3-phosphoglycerate dehydrogenase [Planctomycetia bacterium]|nr:3-phosphoglycerate dehydrogenase [Planctomycetia bacterium]
MTPFRLAITGDFLNERGEDACGGLPLHELDAAQHIAYHVLRDQAPRPGDRDYWSRFYSLEVQPSHLKDLDGLILLRPWLKRGALEAARDRLVVVGRSGAGYDKVDVAACTDCDVALFNAPLALNHPTASTALLFMLALSKRLFEQDRVTRAGRWDKQADVLGDEILGRTLGIIGLGHSGRELVRLVAPFSMKVLGYSPHADATEARALGVELVSLEELLRRSDIVSIHARPRPENRRMIGAAQFALMKPAAYFVNIARGELVDEAALVEVLKNRRIAGAALDVFEHEPLPAGNPLIQLDNVILTPHWSASTSDVWKATGRAMVDGMLRAARGELPDNIVNRDVLSRPGFRAKLARFEENRRGTL